MSRGRIHGLQTSGWGQAAQRVEPREQGTHVPFSTFLPLRVTGRMAPLPPAEVAYRGQQGRKVTPGLASLHSRASQRICPYPAGHRGHK